jgi:hypothetical protein
MAECHAQMPWSARRWNFVTDGLLSRAPQLWWGSVEQLAQALQGAHSVAWQADAHSEAALLSLQTLLQSGPLPPLVTACSQPPLFEDVPSYCDSFSQWWRETRIAL